MKKITTFLIGFLMLVFLVGTLYASDFKILSTKGKVEVSRDQKSWSRVKAPAEIRSGTWVKTGPSGTATIVLPNKTQTKIAKNSELLLRGKSGGSGEVKLKLGKIWAKTNKKPVKIKIKAPNAVASIRGTEWVIEVDNSGSSSLAVMEGNVDLKSNTGITQSVDSGSVATVDRRGKISVAKLVNPGEYLQFVYRYQVEPLAYLPSSLIKSDPEGKIIRRLGYDPGSLSGSEKTLAQRLRAGSFPRYYGNAPAEVYSLIRFANRGKFLRIAYFKEPQNWSNAWKDWLNAFKAESYLAIGDDRRATRHISKIKDDYTKTYVSTKQLISKGLIDEARVSLSKYINSESASVQLTLGEIEKAAGNIKLAKLFFSKAYALANHWHLPALRLASVSTVQGKYDSVKSYLEEAKERNASVVSLASGYAELYSLRNNLAAATETLKFLTRKKEADFQMLTAKGIVELKKGESSNARDTFIEATAIERNYSRAYSFMAVSHLHADEPEIAFRQLELAAKLDPNDPLPHVIASQIYSALLRPEQATREAILATGKTDGERSFGQLANDQQGGANVGRRFLEVGLPDHAREAAVQTRKSGWAGSYLFDAATARSGLERNSKYVMGFILDSQTFGSRRDAPDIVARAGDYGYMEYGAKLGSNKQIDLKYKYGGNGRTIEGTSEFSYLYDLGVYSAQREAYYTPDGEDVSLAALGFFGMGWRENYDHNRFITANIVPFRTGGTFPVNDTTLRFDYGDSKRSDSHTRIIRAGGELGDANVKLNVTTGCTGSDTQQTNKIELGYGEINRNVGVGTLRWSIEGSNANIKSDYTVSHPSAANCTDIDGKTYQDRDEDIRSTESDILLSANLETKFSYGILQLRLKGYNYIHDFDQNRTLDSVAQTPFTSDRNTSEIAASIGYAGSFNGTNLRLGYINDYHPVSQVSLATSDLVGIPTKFEFMKPGSQIKQWSAHLSTNVTSSIRAFVEYDTFKVHNNPIYLLLREQWNADLLENFTLDKFENPNTDDLFSINNNFGAAEVTKSSIALEKVFSNNYSMSIGYQSWDALTLDHPNIANDTAGTRLSGLPESVTYIGFTSSLSKHSILSGRIWKNNSIFDGSTSSTSDTQKYSINYNFANSENNSQLSLGLSGDLGSGSGDHVASVTFRLYF